MRTKENIIGQNYCIGKQIRITQQFENILKAKALEQHTTESTIIRQAIASYIDRNMSDNEILHANITDNTHKLGYLEKKVDLLVVLMLNLVKHTIKVLPANTTNTQSIIDTTFDNFINECTQSLKSHDGILESMILDIYEKQGGE